MYCVVRNSLPSPTDELVEANTDQASHHLAIEDAADKHGRQPPRYLSGAIKIQNGPADHPSRPRSCFVAVFVVILRCKQRRSSIQLMRAMREAACSPQGHSVHSPSPRPRVSRVQPVENPRNQPGGLRSQGRESGIGWSGWQWMDGDRVQNPRSSSVLSAVLDE